MKAGARENRIRLLLSSGCVVILASIYVRELMSVSDFGVDKGMKRIFYGDVTIDILLISLAVVALVSLTPVVMNGTWTHRLFAVIVAAVPSFVLGHFITWLQRLLERSSG